MQLGKGVRIFPEIHQPPRTVTRVLCNQACITSISTKAEDQCRLYRCRIAQRFSTSMLTFSHRGFQAVERMGMAIHWVNGHEVRRWDFAVQDRKHLTRWLFTGWSDDWCVDIQDDPIKGMGRIELQIFPFQRVIKVSDRKTKLHVIRAVWATR